MGDIMKIAKTRQTDLETAIAAREAEIAEMREEVEALVEFQAFGQDLLQRASPAAVGKTNADEVARPEFGDGFGDTGWDDEDDSPVAQLDEKRAQSRPQSRPA